MQDLLKLWIVCITLTLAPLAQGESFTISPGFYQFNYKEFDTGGSLFDKEVGAIPGIELSYSPARASDYIATHINAAWYDGQIDYIGQTQSGIPHNTDSNAQLLKFGLGFDLRRVTLLSGTLFGNLHAWQWDRDILTRNGVQGLHEIYSWSELELGLSFASQPPEQSPLWLRLSLLYITSGSMEIILPAQNASFALGSEPGARLRAGKTWRLSKQRATSLNLFVEYWEFGRSDVVFVADFFGSSAFLVEPRSESLHAGLNYSFIYNF